LKETMAYGIGYLLPNPTFPFKEGNIALPILPTHGR
jgi:hypothetical protein